MIDPTKIRVGDEVTAALIIKKIYPVDRTMLLDGGGWISFDAILSHTPAPRPFVVGGKVLHKGNDCEATILAIDCEPCE